MESVKTGGQITFVDYVQFLASVYSNINYDSPVSPAPTDGKAMPTMRTTKARTINRFPLDFPLSLILFFTSYLVK